jgi:hypothetical protein
MFVSGTLRPTLQRIAVLDVQSMSAGSEAQAKPLNAA